MHYLNVFITGGILCAIGQLIISKTKLPIAIIFVIYVVTGVLLTLFGLYEPVVNFGGAGATVPLTGFGYALAKGVKTAVMERGFMGAFTGGLTATSAGITAAMLFGFIAALIAKPRGK